MRSPTCLVVLCLLAGCNNAPLATTLVAASPAPAPDVFQCARAQIKAMQFAQSSIDLDKNRLNARKYDDDARRSDVQFRRVIDRLEIEAKPGTGGAATTFKVIGRTFAEYTTQRGPTEVQERTSETANKAARTMIAKCGGDAARADSVAADSVPPAGQS